MMMILPPKLQTINKLPPRMRVISCHMRKWSPSLGEVEPGRDWLISDDSYVTTFFFDGSIFPVDIDYMRTPSFERSTFSIDANDITLALKAHVIL
ncbi:hypothetical protein AMTR_s00060p00140310 [Amborella trichopoda]|uniref:Uncharacterized protein n=1 Tax=Amborella trichopoda TaxID=13333 RepID=W1NK86_AMBTC|nr:hypothetical protein AMTR_s00060p00140310 [Amborella trichopoda]